MQDYKRKKFPESDTVDTNKIWKVTKRLKQNKDWLTFQSLKQKVPLNINHEKVTKVCRKYQNIRKKNSCKIVNSFFSWPISSSGFRNGSTAGVCIDYFAYFCPFYTQKEYLVYFRLKKSKISTFLQYDKLIYEKGHFLSRLIMQHTFMRFYPP